jgi:hypothetical protein
MKDLHENSTASLREQQASGASETFRRRVFETISTALVPMTDREVMEALGEAEVNNVRPEITRLKQDGLLVETGKTKCAWTGKQVRQTKATGAKYAPHNNWKENKCEN